MKKFFNYLVVIILLLLGALGGVTFYISTEIEKMFYKNQPFMYDNKAVIYKKIISYKKGLFASSAITEIKILNMPTAITMHHTILHGPIVITKDLQKPVDFKFAIIKSYFDESVIAAIPVSFVVSTVLNYKKEVESTINIKSSLPKYTNDHIQIANWFLESFIHVINDHSVDFKCTAAASSIQINDSGSELVVEGVDLKANQTMNSLDEGAGNLAVKVEKIIYKPTDTSIINLILNATDNVQNRLLNYSYELNIEKIVNKQQLYGPLHFKLLIDNIDLSPISSKQANLQNDNLDTIYKSFLLKKPKLIIDHAYLSLPQGIIKVNVDLAFSEPALNVNDSAAKAAMPIDIPMVGVDGEISLAISKEVLKQILIKIIQNELIMHAEYEKLDPQKKQQELDVQVNNNLQKAIQNGMLIETKDTYETKIIIAQNNFIVNEKPIIDPRILIINCMQMFKAARVAENNPPILPQQPIILP